VIDPSHAVGSLWCCFPSRANPSRECDGAVAASGGFEAAASLSEPGRDSGTEVIALGMGNLPEVARWHALNLSDKAASLRADGRNNWDAAGYYDARQKLQSFLTIESEFRSVRKAARRWARVVYVANGG